MLLPLPEPVPVVPPVEEFSPSVIPEFPSDGLDVSLPDGLDVSLPDGNGFDLYHNLPTSYSHFKDYLNKKDNTSNTVSFLEYIFGGSLWSDFEKSIGRPNIDVVYRLSQEEEKRLPKFNKQKCALENICDALIQIKLLFTEWVTYVKCLQYKCWKKL